MSKQPRKKGEPRKQPVSLHPLRPEEAVADLLKIKPPPEKKKRGAKAARKRSRRKS